MIPYGRQSIDAADIAAVSDVLRSAWLTTGPKVADFEVGFATVCGARHAVAVSSGTAALHTAMYALGVGPGDEVIVPAITFPATANAAVFLGATPVFADVHDETLLLDVDAARRKVTGRTKLIVAVDYAGHPCDYDELRRLTSKNGLALVADACHAMGAGYKERTVGTLADLNTFSLHPVKHITSGEGGVVTTNDRQLAARMGLFRTHGITRDAALFDPEQGALQDAAERGAPWYYEMIDLGYNYRISDINCALGLSQLAKLEAFVARRRDIAAAYTAAFADMPGLRVPQVMPWAQPSWHLYVVRLDFARLGKSRAEVVSALRERGVGTQVHYIPVHLQPYYRRRFNTRSGDCPVAEQAYREILSLPMFPAMSDDDVQTVIRALRDVCG